MSNFQRRSALSAFRVTGGDTDAWLALARRILVAVLFLPDGLGKLFRFEVIEDHPAEHLRRGQPFAGNAACGRR